MTAESRGYCKNCDQFVLVRRHGMTGKWRCTTCGTKALPRSHTIARLVAVGLWALIGIAVLIAVIRNN